jgi:acyl-CoA thioesterase
MLFSEILQSLRQSQERWTAPVPEDWLQGRSLFGGLQAALALRAMRGLIRAGVPLRVLQTTFVAPIAGPRIDLEARVLRSGKSTVHLEARLLEGDQTAAHVLAIFGSGRPSRVHHLPRQEPVSDEQAVEVPFVAGLTPSFTRHFTTRWLRGHLPFTGGSLSQAVIEVGIKDPAPTSEEHVAALADAIPPVALSHLQRAAPGSSMAWTLEMLRDRVDDLPLAGWRLDAQMRACRDGYTNQSVMVWGPGGEPVALSRQCMVIFG